MNEHKICKIESGWLKHRMNLGLKGYNNNSCFYLIQSRKNNKSTSLLFGGDDVMFTGDKEKTQLFFNFATLSRFPR